MGRINMAAALLAGCAACGGGSGATEQVVKSAASDTVRCSASMGPMVGPNDTLVDAGDVQECGPGGQCLSGPFPGPQPVCTVITEPSDGAPGTVQCPPSSGPTWACVYQSGQASPGGDGGGNGPPPP
jgi:hypothetical protein